MQGELIIAGVAALGLILWLWPLNRHPRWLILLGSVGLMGWIALLPGWLEPVQGCGSVLFPEYTAGHGDCDWVLAERYNPTLPVFITSSLMLIVSGAAALMRSTRAAAERRRHQFVDRAVAPAPSD